MSGHVGEMCRNGIREEMMRATYHGWIATAPIAALSKIAVMRSRKHQTNGDRGREGRRDGETERDAFSFSLSRIPSFPPSLMLVSFT